MNPMNIQKLDEEERVMEDINWLARRANNVSPKEEHYFCHTIKDALARGWVLMDARHYALGKLMGTHAW